MSRNTNKPAVQGAAQALDQFKYEIATELGISNYATVDKGALTSRQNGYVGGYMTRNLVQLGEQALMSKYGQQ